VLKNKQKRAALSQTGCLFEKYLTILLRELKSMLPKPPKLKDFKGIPPETIEKLELLSLGNMEQIYSRVISEKDRCDLSNTTGITIPDIVRLAHLADLTRIKWVGTTFAEILIELGIDSVQKVAEQDPTELHSKVNGFIQEHQIYKGKIGINDIHILIQAAGELSIDLEC
jgi:hypothetical protein